ncbi:MAG: murein L,D-transpeptidase [Acidimicrobiales bacterium]|nr:MAG: murein L,D-transpeptidase [Acidimicrobiales bacterium]
MPTMLVLVSASGGGTAPVVPVVGAPAPMLMSRSVSLVKAFYARPETTATVPPAPGALQIASPPPTGSVPATAPGTTTLATLTSDVSGSAGPGLAPGTTVPASWYGYRSTLPVIDQRPGWVEVRLAQRPNQSTVWVPANRVTFSSTPYRLVLSLGAERMQLLRYDQPILNVPAGIGTVGDPTVTGHYFVTMKVPPPDPGYGPFVLATSAHSDTITDWARSGDAIIAIHGPIDSHADALIGKTGARISHGCIRLHDADLAQLGAVPAGTPLDVVP